MPADYRGFDQTSPPRHVPFVLRLRLAVHGLFGLVGWIFLGVGMVLAWVFLGDADLGAGRDFGGDVERVTGVVTRVQDTRATIQNSGDAEKIHVTAYHYRFTIGWSSYGGVSYEGKGVAAPGDSVTVEYPVGRPERSRIAGMRTTMFPNWVWVVAIFPGIGLVFVLLGVRRGRRQGYLLTYGKPALAVLKDKKRTLFNVNNRPVYKLIFEFEDERGREHDIAAMATDTETLEDEEREPALYDPDAPAIAAVIDNMSGTPFVGADGVVRSEDSVPTWSALIMPGAVIGGNLWWVWHRYLAG